MLQLADANDIILSSIGVPLNESSPASVNPDDKNAYPSTCVSSILLKAVVKASQKSCATTPSTTASSTPCDSPMSLSGEDEACAGRSKREFKLPAGQTVQIQKAKADSPSIESDQEMKDLFRFRDTLAAFRQAEDISAEAVKQTLWVISQLSKKDMTVQILRKTGLGLECSKSFLVRHSSPEVLRASRELVTHWKAIANMKQVPKTKASTACGGAKQNPSNRHNESETIDPVYLTMSEDNWEPKVEPLCPHHIKNLLKQKDTQIARLQDSIERRKSLNKDDVGCADEILEHYETMLEVLHKESEELRHQVCEA